MEEASFLSFRELFSFPTQERLNVWQMVYRSINVPNLGLLYRQETWSNEAFLRQELTEGIKYYEAVQHELPQLQEAGLFKGVFEYFMGRQPEAINTFMAEAQARPDLFWVQYDLGIINLENKKLDLADNFFEKALRISVKKTFNIMLSSILYRQLLPDIPAQEMVNRLREARERCLHMRAMIHQSPEKINPNALRNMGFSVTYF